MATGPRDAAAEPVVADQDALPVPTLAPIPPDVADAPPPPSPEPSPIEPAPVPSVVADRPVPAPIPRAITPPASYVYPRAPTPRPYAYPPPPPPIPSRGDGAPSRTVDRPAGMGFPTPEEAAYESRVRNGAMSAQGQKGPLDGGWLVEGTDGARLFAFQLIDEGFGTLDGAWRTAEGMGRSGFFAFASRSGSGLTLRFMERPGATLSTLTLSSGADGRSWTGELEQGGAARSVIMRPL